MPNIGSGNAYDGSIVVPMAIAFAWLVGRSLTTRRALFLHEVAQPVGGFAVHHPVALARRCAIAVEGLRIDLEVAEIHRLLDQQVAAGDQHDLPRRQAAEQKHRAVARR